MLKGVVRKKTADTAAMGSGELGLIEYIRRRASATRPRQGRELRLGIGDDCAILQPRPGEEIVVTTDFCLESRHFRRDWHPPASVGHRTLARGLSDLAAMGARPVAAFLSLALPRTVAADTVWVEGFFDGLLRLAERTRVPLAGGDTAEAPGPHILADIALLGAVPAGEALRRSGARPGDRIFCTGTLGGAAAELAGLAERKQLARGRQASRDEDRGHPQLYPEPRLALGQMLRQRGLATAAIDISDGLSTDLNHLCAASDVRAEIDAESIPLHALASLRKPRKAADEAAGPAPGDALEPALEPALRWALHGGEDYELLFTVRAGVTVPRSFQGVPLTRIGKIARCERSRPRVSLVTANGRSRELPAGGWEHLR